MARLEIRLLGTMQIIRPDGRPLRLPPSVQSLFAYILLFQARNQPLQGYRREALANLFWRDQPEKNARRCLSTALWRLRRELNEQNSASYLLPGVNGEIGFDFASDHWLDIEAFERGVQAGLSVVMEEMRAEHVAALETAVQLYTGELLENCYEEWALRERERLNLLYIRCLGRLMRYYRHHEIYEQGIYYGKKILAADPLREQVHRELILIYMVSGQRVLAIQQYDMCRRVLAEELGIEPTLETRVLYEQLVGVGKRPSAVEPILHQLMGRLNAAVINLEVAQAQLQEIRQDIALLARSEMLQGD
ncbi:MAG: hypothetical protein KA362_04855 [Chloroflexi bacterium]|nr:hypothetical protein [Chloroflexota bacterium]MBK7175940.1 hypothetical protein [Chloroflexota bacterium]MBK7916545.1 hypothetical protein [Chloroflexota bacterium]MBK8934495.1 hypothetical protein [Chloroflexota bacterium]MBP6803416.1 hypothetical protein [Chloroflexota bacterium]